MNSTGNTMTTAKIRREASTVSTHRELPAPSSSKLVVPNNPSAWIILFFQLSGFFILVVIFSGYIGSLGSFNRIKDKLGLVEKALGPLAAQIIEKESLVKTAHRISPREPSCAAVIKPSSPQPLNKMPDAIPIVNQPVTQAAPSVEVKTAAFRPVEDIADPIPMANQLATQKVSPVAESKTSPFNPPATKPRHSKQYHTVKRGETLYSISKQYGISVDEIRHINNLRPNKPIQTDQKLLVNYK
jgi:LysM repeat protein